MTQLIIYITPYQAKKLKEGKKKCKNTQLQITSKNLHPFNDEKVECVQFKFSGEREHLQKIESLKNCSEKGVRLAIKPSNFLQEGGFITLPLILGGIGALTGVVGTAANTVINHNKAKDEIKELKEHFANIEKTYEKKGGLPPLTSVKDLDGVDVFKARQLDEQRTLGSGWADCRRKVEYKHVGSLSDIIDRLKFIKAQESAGNTNGFTSEKYSISVFLKDQIDQCTDTDRLVAISEVLHPTKGSGIINTFINKLPIEAHIPGYRYLGPGTYLDVKYPKDIKGVNKLDEAAKEHDIAYHFNRDVASRREADKTLENKAWNIFKDPETKSGEKIAAWLTTTAMKTKGALGAGIYNFEKKLPDKYLNGAGLPSTKMERRW